MTHTSHLNQMLKQHGIPLAPDPNLPSQLNNPFLGRLFIDFYKIISPKKDDFFYCFVLLSDALLHHIWNHQRNSLCLLENFQQLLDTIQFTNRCWNSKNDLTKTLLHITLRLNIDINLIGVILHTKIIDHPGIVTYNNKPVLPYYKFQNPTIKLAFSHSSPFYSVYMVQFKNQYFVVPSNLFQPILINLPQMENINHQNTVITTKHIYDIVKHTSPPFPFSVILYSTYSYVTKHHTKKIQNSIVGFYQNSNDPEHTIHIFLSPHFSSIRMSVLNWDLNTHHLNIKNIYSHTRPTEGIKINGVIPHINRDLLNQNYCICEHPDTQRYELPNNINFKNLGMNLLSMRITLDTPHTFIYVTASTVSQKNFLWENLGNFHRNLAHCHKNVSL